LGDRTRYTRKTGKSQSTQGEWTMFSISSEWAELILAHLLLAVCHEASRNPSFSNINRLDHYLSLILHTLHSLPSLGTITRETLPLNRNLNFCPNLLSTSLDRLGLRLPQTLTFTLRSLRRHGSSRSTRMERDGNQRGK